MDNLRQVAYQRSLSRREFLRSMTVAGASTTFGFASSPIIRNAAVPKTVVVTFGGGARDEETFAPDGQENIPHLLSELIPQATFFTQVVNHGILGHYVATASLATGVYENFDNFADVTPKNPTVFEYFRKGLKRPLSDAWVIAPSNGFNRLGQSDASRIEAGFGAQVVLPKRLLATALGKKEAPTPGAEFILRDNYEDAIFAPPAARSYERVDELTALLRISVDEFIRQAATLSSADALSVYILRHVMAQFSPSLIWITLHDMDVAHMGSYSLYVDAIRRTDQCCFDIWNLIEKDPEYRGRTNLLILPDFGRDSDISSGGNGFQHHRTGDPLSRTTWMMAVGPHVRQNTTVDRPLDSLDLVPTIGRMMGFDTPFAHGRPAVELI